MSWSAPIAMLLLLLSPSVSYAQEFRLSPAGFGPAHIGMTLGEASKQLGVPLVKVQGTYQDARYVVVPSRRYVGLSFTVSATGIIDGAYVGYDSPRFKTDRNLHIGSSANDVWRAYGSQIEVKAYQCGSAFLIYTYRSPRDPNSGVIYTVSDSGLVQGIMAGTLSTVSPPC
jgi:hypothetical protein